LNSDFKKFHNSVQSNLPEQFFKEACQVFSEAEQAMGGAIDRYYLIGGYSIRLRFAGPALLPFLTPALSHLQINPVLNPDLTILFWDSKSTGTKMARPPWSTDDYLQFGLINGYNTERFKTQYMNALNMIDLDKGKAVYWIPDIKNVSYYRSIRPLRTILNWWMNEHQRFIVHAASLGLTEGGVVITNKACSGKSTTALSCIGSSLKYAGDENCLISLDPEPYAYSLYCTGTLEPEDIDRIPKLKSYIINASKLQIQKAIYLFKNDHQALMITGFPIKAVLIPSISGKADTMIQRRIKKPPLLALAPGSLFQLPGVGGDYLGSLAELIKRVPCYSLELGTQIDQIPLIIERFIRSQL